MSGKRKSGRKHNISIAGLGKGMVGVLSSLIMLVIFFYSMKSSFSCWYDEFNDYTTLLIPRMKDNFAANVVVLLLMLLLAYLIYHFTGRMTGSGKEKNFIVWIAGGAVLTVSILFVISLRVIPSDDASIMVDIVQKCLSGNWSDFNQGGYMSNYYHQVGLFGVLYFLSKYIPEGWWYYQILNCLALMGMLIVGYKLTKKIWSDAFTSNTYILLQGLCIPAYIYVCFIYGEILSTFLCICTIYAVVSALEGRITGISLLLTMFFMFGSMWIRKNALVVLVALVLCVLWKAIADKKLCYLKIAVALALALALYNICANVSFSEHMERHESIPAIAWVVMGMEKNAMGYGSFNSFTTETFKKTGYSAELTRQASYKEIRRIANYYLENPKEGLEFYKEKILWQWTDPSYECLLFTCKFENEGILRDIYYGDLRKPFWSILEWCQNFVYFGAFFAFLCELKSKKRSVQIIFPVIFLGYFFFSIMWEAKPRYMVMCYIMLLPMAAYGIAQFCKGIEMFTKKLIYARQGWK